MSGYGGQLKGDYSPLDRALHHLAFRSPWLQRILADLESDIFRGKINSITGGKEIFVTGLPRSGTTLILNALYGTGEFASFTYRQMPFLLTPILWHKASNSFQLSAVCKERAHGDKVSVSFNSPEAFEEAVWLAYMRDRIETDQYLRTVEADGYTHDLANGLQSTIAKLIVLSEIQNADESRQYRYLSKNNANVSRLGALRRLFPDSLILVPFREPAAHVASLMQQHARFLERHEDDAFARHYMRWIGHFEFGKNLKPINYGNWLENREIHSDMVGQDFWLEYWIRSYRYTLEHLGPWTKLVDFDALLADGKGMLAKIADLAMVTERERLTATADTFRAPTTTPIGYDSFSTDLWQGAVELHEKLVALAIE